jgi:hypothetical protein
MRERMQKNRWSRIFTVAGLLLIFGGSFFAPNGLQGASSREKRGKIQTQRTERDKTANEDLMSAMGRFAVRQAENLGRGTVIPKKGGTPSLTLEDLGEDEATSNPAGARPKLPSRWTAPECMSSSATTTRVDSA